MSYGLKGKVKEMITRMDAMRQDPETPRDIGLRQFMAEEYTDSNNNPLGPEHLYSELGIEPQSTRVKDVMAQEDTKYLVVEIIRDGVRIGMGLAQRDQIRRAREAAVSQGPVTSDGGSQRFMSPEVFLDAQRLGLVQSTFYPDLIVREETVPQPTVTMPTIDLSKATLVDSNEAATIEEGSVSYGSRDVKLRKKARGLKVTYEAIQYNSLSLMQIFFQDAGQILGHTLNNMAVDVIVNGDQAGGTQAAAVIGVDNTTNGITWKDYMRVAIRGGLIGRTFSQVLGNETTSLNFMMLPEVKDRVQGTPLMNATFRSPLQLPSEVYPSLTIPTNQVALQDPSMSLVQLTSMPLMVETEKIVSKQIEASYASITTGFAKLMRTASIIIDGSILYSANQFPAWMAPFSTE
jgi:hypothetical protein